VGSLSRAITYDRDERGITVKGREPYGDTGLVLVAGVTPRQGGRESRPQGEGGQVMRMFTDWRYA
jgi:hypothetical protein